MNIMRRIFIGTGLVIAAAIVGFQFTPTARHQLPSGTGIVAKQLCSLTWVSGLDSDFARSLYLDPLLGTPGTLISHRINTENKSVSAAILGLFWKRTAYYRKGLGCTLVHGTGTFDKDLTVPHAHAFQPFELDTDHRDTHFDVQALDAAIQRQFESTQTKKPNTLGVAVFHQGKLVAERYAPGASRETRFLGWSMTKSAITTLAGRLHHLGRIDIFAPDAIPVLRDAPDDRSAITINHLLRMTGGLEMHEINDGYDPNSQMLFGQSDMAAFAARARRLHEPGEHWEYMSGDTILATSAMQAQLGAALVDQTRALRALVFEPLGIHSAVMEADESGTFQGSSYMYATAHDWARLAILYMNDGIAQGRRLLPQDWYKQVSTQTAGSETRHKNRAYGMGFWLPVAADNLPADTIMLRGFQAQSGHVMPSEQLVIVRFGATNDGGGLEYTNDLARAVIAAKHADLAE